MNDANLTGLRNLWNDVTTEKAPTYRLYDGKGRCVMFGITKERAEEYLRYYPGGRVVAE